jgi:predicted enzyme related to lactoylglutathione lyase
MAGSLIAVPMPYGARMANLAMVTIDCDDPRSLAKFWTAALDTTVDADYGDYLMLAPPAGGTVRLGLQRVPEPKNGKTRIHLDLIAPDRRAEVSRLVDLGATVLDEHQMPGLGWTVLSDPEGNEFCVGELADD